MRRRVLPWALALTLIASAPIFGGEPPNGESPHHGFLQRLHPAGGWHPYGGGLTHWWNPHCLPRYAAPDDYCRKPLPTVCWPSYPPYYNWGVSEIGYPRNDGFDTCTKPH
jgi:hypothetical protein